jgi:hypothetical protein
MNCKNHPVNAAKGSCAGCSKPFCFNCTVEMKSKLYCSECKVMALEGNSLPASVLEAYGGTRTCELATEALQYALVGIVCVGFILEPIALFKALQAQRELAENPHLDGKGKASAAVIISSIMCILYLLGFVMAIVGER